MSDDSARIVRFWHAVEMFSPQQLPKTDAGNYIADFQPANPLPWEPAANLPAPEPGKTWRHEIFAGIYDLGKVRDVLVSEFGEDDPEAAPAHGHSALFACTVDAGGYLIEESAVLSACAWAVGQVVRSNKTLTGFHQDALGYAEDLRKLAGVGENSAPLSGSALHRFTAGLADRLGVTDRLQPRDIRISSYEISVDHAEDPPGQQPFLNSHVADDLAFIAAAVDRGEAGTALIQYLSARTHPARTDVRKEPLAVRQGCDPDRIPAGRWVTDIARPLVLSQQFAVNQIMRTLGNAPGLFAVTGPPGTGKTTVLRDVIAAIVVGRAIEIARLPSPGAAFTIPSESWQTPDHQHTITPLSPGLTGFEIVVASAAAGGPGQFDADDGEIQGPDGIDDLWRNAARLGNQPNRGMLDVLRPGADPLSDWRGAVASFDRALSRVKALSDERSVVSRSITQLSATEQDLARASTSLATATVLREELEARWPGTDEQLRVAQERCQLAGATVAAHRAGKPGLFAFPSARHRAARRAWDAEHAELRGRLVVASRQQDEALRTAQDLANQLARTRREEEGARDTRDRLTREADGLRAQVTHARQRWGGHVPDGPDYAETGKAAAIERREKSAPWADAEFTTARTELFLAALALHKALILAEAARFRQNLGALMDILDGKGRPSDTATLAAWQTFFLLVPVMSTTLTSFARLSGGLGRESLGWLFIDEAGQAPPQYAVGALWRTRRAVIVGDPRQLKPAVMLPWGGQRTLLSEFGVSEQWAPSQTSVQQVAGRLAEHGTALPTAESEEPLWAGTPLRVHRRCDRPIFDISNQIAYDGLMVFGTPERPPFGGREDMWCDIRSTTSDGHWIPAEGTMLGTVLAQLRDDGVPAARIRVISPFRVVAGHARTVHESVFPEVSERDRDNWVGTVHTVRGKEADVVILILGGDPDHPGARRFAAGEPNLLNVAVSRARRRLYVIGNLDSWGAEPFFNVLATRIPAWRA